MNFTDIRGFLYTLVDIIKELHKFLNVLFKYRKLQLLIIIILVIICVLLGSTYWELNKKSEKIVYKTLLLKNEATPQNYKGMEAFILSYIDQDLSNQIKNNKISPKAIGYLDSIKNRIDSFLIEGNNYKPILKVVSAENVKVLTDYNDNGFLFLPINILRKNFNNNELNEIKKAKEKITSILLDEIHKEKELMFDIELTKSLSKPLQAFTLKPMFKKTISSVNEKPAQVYIITKNGINRIFNKHHINNKSASDYYGKQFPASTYFPDRPYFLAAFSDKKFYSRGTDELVPEPNALIGDYFYVSKPYMDLAGNGFVITLSRGIEIEGKLKAVLCFDLYLYSNSAKTTITSVLDKIADDLGINSPTDRINVKGTILEDGSLEIHDDESSLANNFKDIVNNDLPNNEVSTVKGNIFIFNNESENGILKVSLPIGNSGKSNEVEFQLFKIDLNQLHDKTLKIAIGFCVTLASIIFLLSYLYASTIKRSEEYERAFNQLDDVMYKNPIPYCRLDSSDKIKDANPAFCEILNYNPKIKEDLELLKRKEFISLCADDDSRNKYKEIESQRKEGKLVKPYQIQFKCKFNDMKLLTVVSGQYPFSLKGELPETFGILLDLTKDEHRKYFVDFPNFEFPKI